MRLTSETKRPSQTYRSSQLMPTQPNPMKDKCSLRRTSIRNVVAQVLAEVGPMPPGNSTASRKPQRPITVGRPKRYLLPDAGRSRFGRALHAFEQLRERTHGGSQANHRHHPTHLHRAMRRAGYDGNERETRSADWSTRSKNSKRSASRTPGVEFLETKVLQRRPWPGGHRTTLPLASSARLRP